MSTAQRLTDRGLPLDGSFDSLIRASAAAAASQLPSAASAGRSNRAPFYSRNKIAATATATATATVTASTFTISSAKSGDAKPSSKASGSALAQIVAVATTATAFADDSIMLDGEEAAFWHVEEERAAKYTGTEKKRQQEHGEVDRQQRPQHGEARHDSEDDAGGKKPSTLARLRRRVLSVQQLWIWPFTHYKPTNQVMLCYRTLWQDLRARRANEDFLAAKFRDELMPLRGWVHRKLPALLHINKAFIQGPAFGCPGIMTYLDARTRWLDDEVASAIREGFTQVVVVAAGYDTRAYRLSAPGVSYFEIDLPEASERKRQLVERTLPADQFPRPTYVAADLSQVSIAEALLGERTANVATTPAHIVKRIPTGASAASGAATDGASVNLFKPGSFSTNATTVAACATTAASGAAGGACGFNPRARTLFTVEGLLYYLPPLAVARLLVSIRAVAGPGSRVAFDFLHQDVFSGRRWEPGYETLRLTVRNKGEPKRSGLDPAGLRDYLAPMGWRLTYLPTPREVAAAMYPDKQWTRLNPPLPPFYNFAVAEAE